MTLTIPTTTSTYPGDADTEDPRDIDWKGYILDDGFNIAIIAVTFLLALIGVGLNIGVMGFHRKHLKSRINSFIYFILSLSDFCTCLCAFLHALIFSVLMGLKNKVTVHLIWLILPAYFFTVIAFKVSAFVSLLFAVIRTISIVTPFKTVNKRAVVLATGLYTFLWVIVFAVDVGVFVHVNWSNLYAGKTIILQGIMSRFYYPSKAQFVEHLARENGHTSSGLECLADTLYTIPPVFLCAGIAFIATIVQVYFLSRPQGSITAGNQDQLERKNVSITIILINVIFIVCASFTLYEPWRFCFHASALKDRRVFYATGYLPFFVNSALNPLVLFIRVKSFRTFLGEKTTGIKLIGPQNIFKMRSICSSLSKSSAISMSNVKN